MSKQTMGEFLALLRKANGFTQQDVADKLNISNRTLSSWETDRTTPDVLLLPAIADLYGVTVDELLRCERNSTATGERQLSENALRAQRKHSYGKYSAKCYLLSGFGCFGSVLLALSFILALYTTCPLWLFILLVVLSACDIIVCTAILLYFHYNTKLASGLILKEDYTAENRAYALGLKRKTAKYFLICAIPLLAFTIAMIITAVIIQPENFEVAGIEFDVVGLYIATICTTGVLGIAFLLAYFIYGNTNLKILTNEKQAANRKINSKLLGKTVGFGVIPVIVTMILMIVFILVTPQRTFKTLFTANSPEEVKQNFQTLTYNGDEIYLDFNEDEENKIFFTESNKPNETNLYNLGHKFYGEPDLLGLGFWTVWLLDDELPPAQLDDYEYIYDYFTYVGRYTTVYFYNPESDSDDDSDRKAVNVAYRNPDYIYITFSCGNEYNIYYYHGENVWRYNLDVQYNYSYVFITLFLVTCLASAISITTVYFKKRKKQSYEY